MGETGELTEEDLSEEEIITRPLEPEIKEVDTVDLVERQIKYTEGMGLEKSALIFALSVVGLGEMLHARIKNGMNENEGNAYANLGAVKDEILSELTDEGVHSEENSMLLAADAMNSVAKLLRDGGSILPPSDNQHPTKP